MVNFPLDRMIGYENGQPHVRKTLKERQKKLYHSLRILCLFSLPSGLFPDHLHLTLSVYVTESPSEAALTYLNNLVWTQGMKAVVQSGVYVGIFGEYDIGVATDNRNR